MAAVEELQIQSLHSCVGEASTKSLRCCLNQSDMWFLIYCREKGKISGCFRNRTSIVLQQCQNQVSFQRNGSAVGLKFLLNFVRDSSIVYS